VALYEGKSSLVGYKIEVNGIPFCFAHDLDFARLDGATLAWSNGRFEVKERAI
jgi:hypothetical protein